MKYNINNKMILLATLSTFTLSGCIAKNEVKATPISYKQFSVKKASSWKKVNQQKVNKKWKTIGKKQDDCVDCYATDMGSTKRVPKKAQQISVSSNTNIAYDYSKAPSQKTIDANYYEYKTAQRSESIYDKSPINTLHYGAYDYTVEPTEVKRAEAYKRIKVASRPSNIYSSKSSYVSGTTIQVGAFRHYSGAKKIARKYDLLSSKYNVKIETGVKGNSPIHRVRIEGFNSKREAKKFMARYAINDAFLVRR